MGIVKRFVPQALGRYRRAPGGRAWRVLFGYVLCARQLKVFCSYRSTDGDAVEAFATRLRHEGLDAWFDKWEVARGDDLVARMDEGVDGCEAALIFVSGAWFDGAIPYATSGRTSLPLRLARQQG